MPFECDARHGHETRKKGEITVQRPEFSQLPPWTFRKLGKHSVENDPASPPQAPLEIARRANRRLPPSVDRKKAKGYVCEKHRRTPHFTRCCRELHPLNTRLRDTSPVSRTTSVSTDEHRYEKKSASSNSYSGISGGKASKFFSREPLSTKRNVADRSTLVCFSKKTAPAARRATMLNAQRSRFTRPPRVVCALQNVTVSLRRLRSTSD